MISLLLVEHDAIHSIHCGADSTGRLQQEAALHTTSINVVAAEEGFYDQVFQ